LLQVVLAGRAFAAGIDHAADTSQVAFLQLRDFRADFDDTPDDLMARHHRVEGITPVAPRLMHIGMADAAIENFNLDIVRPRLAPLDAERRHRGFGILNGISADGRHVISLSGSGLAER
jgi:hypothetical protein